MMMWTETAMKPHQCHPGDRAGKGSVSETVLVSDLPQQTVFAVGNQIGFLAWRVPNCSRRFSALASAIAVINCSLSGVWFGTVDRLALSLQVLLDAYIPSVPPCKGSHRTRKQIHWGPWVHICVRGCTWMTAAARHPPS
jgi:hypothetical protein